ncbi:hypothetical protein B7R54_01705 [Subtercola boreus]|uniref:ApeA N-terminal domain-containing protein n=2 Tax=Subtercola boreus TaxID=120213 RepID=A0A3E0VFC6_9MICO|nr:hypothetical protein B7R54_01705 [Subtercola boreus]TQL55050.1 hypothetical protein FB464_2605 [Subtercola boreus]
MLFASGDGRISLFGIRFSGYQMTTPAVGHFDVDEAVLHDRDGDISDSFVVASAQSHIDGLAEWTGFTAVTEDVGTNEAHLIQQVVATVKTADSFSWRQGDAEMTLTTHWEGDHSRPGIHVDEWVVLDSKFPEARPFSAHITEHRKLVSLLTLVFGTGISFRKHQIRDELFRVRNLDGELIGAPPLVEVIARQTIRDYSEQIPARSDLKQSGIVFLQQLKGEGLSQWAEGFGKWGRVINPTVGVLKRPDAYAEDVVMSTNLSLEAAGHLLPPADDEESTYFRGRPTTATFVYRCIASVGMNFSPISHSRQGMARAVANNYNGIKHFDRGAFPDFVQTRLIGKLSTLIVRLIATNLIEPTNEVVRDYVSGWRFRQLMEEFKLNDLYVDERGNCYVPQTQQ